ncbi:MAG: Virus attachment protein p12 family protein [Firmicutes bacterium ADurb.Bin419]|nr:MAG: Virus attachment protein p12 family protein [Firmicutes bacterium ADurb.Bin419]
MATVIIGILALAAFLCAGYYTYKNNKNKGSCGNCSGCTNKGSCNK